MPIVPTARLPRRLLAAFAIALLALAPCPAPVSAATYATEPAFGNVVFQQPVEIVFAPGETHRAFVVEREGRIALIRDLAQPTREVLLDLTSLVGNSGPDHGLLALAFHPDFATNGHFYLWFSTSSGGQRFNRLARFTATQPAGNAIAVALASQQPLISQPNGPGGHDGGQMFFGPDGYLYLSIGDGDVDRDAEARASHQRIDRGFYGCVLRLDVDQRAGSLAPNAHPAVHAGTYRVPADNPFVGATSFNGTAVDPAAVRTEMWALGLRNPFRLSRDPVTGAIWCADVGLDLYEEINLITKGGNYGWDYREAFAPGPANTPAPAAASFIDPIFFYGHDLGLSITGGLVYRAGRFPDLRGRYLFGDFLSGRIWALHDDGRRPLPAAQATPLVTMRGIVAFAVDPRQGDILLVNLFDGVIRRLVVEDASPRLINLSARASVGGDDAVLVPGFVIAGGSKTVLVRAAGPTLAAPPFNLTGTAARPELRLIDAGGTELARNAGWSTSADASALRAAAARVGAFAFVEGSADAALLATLEPGAYTAVTRSLAAPGLAVVEVYDADASLSPGRLINSAIRGHVGSGNAALFGGLVLRGTTPRTVLVRAAGPALTNYDVAGALAAPVLTLRRGDEIVATNTGWTTAPDPAALAAATSAVGAFAFAPGSADSAAVVTLTPGAYTVEVSGVAGATGVALLEVYEVP